MWSEVWGSKLYKYSWNICCSNKNLDLPSLNKHCKISQHFQLQSSLSRLSSLSDAVTVMNKEFHRLLIICDFHSDGLAWTSGMSGKVAGVAVLSLAAVAAGCYYVFKVCSKNGLVCALNFIPELQNWSTKYRGGGRSCHGGNGNNWGHHRLIHCCVGGGEGRGEERKWIFAWVDWPTAKGGRGKEEAERAMMRWHEMLLNI